MKFRAVLSTALLLGLILLGLIALSPNVQAQEKNNLHRFIHPVLKDLACSLNPTDCSLPNCPPDCLYAPQNENDFQQGERRLVNRLSPSGIKAQRSDNEVVLSSEDKKQASIKYRVERTSESNFVIYYQGSIDSKIYDWKAIYSPANKTVQEDRPSTQAFKRFISDGSKLFEPNLGVLIARGDADTQEITPDERDHTFCGIIGILTSSVNPVGGAAFWTLCEYFVYEDPFGEDPQ
jgi:hypothetical protein